MVPFFSMRLGERQQVDHSTLSAFIEMFRRNPGSCDEVWFATSYGYPTVEEHLRLADRIGEAARLVRRNGIRASIQISNTIGHGAYNSVRDFGGFDWDDMVGPDGTHAVYCACPRDPRFLDYISTITRAYVRFQPDYVWIDDDLRMHHHHPVEYGCFCGRCVAAFNEELATDFDRDTLVRAVNDAGSWETRRKLVAFNQRAMLQVASAVCGPVQEVSPESVVGVQQASFAWSSYSGGDYRALYDGIKEITGRPSACRPGGGYYNDHAPRALLDKAINLSLQTQRMTADMTVSQAEVENIPHNVSGKSVRGTLIESAVYLAYGCTSLSFSAFMIPNEAPSFYEPLFAGLAGWREFLSGYARLSESTVSSGAGIVFSESHYTMDMNGRPPFAWSRFGGDEVYRLLSYGLPLAWQNDRTPVLLLHNEALDGLSTAEIEAVFSSAVITDARTAEKLIRRGMGEVLGMEVEAFDEMKSIDCCTDHPVNGPYAGQSWYDFYTTSARNPPLKLVRTGGEDAEVIGTYVLRGDESVVTGVSSLLVRTSLGGKAAVFGYNPWSNLVNSAKRHQILNAADWVCGGRMPVYVATPSQAAVIPRVDGDGRLVSAMVVNVSIDGSPPLSVALRSPRSTRVTWVTPEGGRTTLEAAGSDAELRVQVPALGPWALGVLEIGREGGRG